jgi:ethanolamine permease
MADSKLLPSAFSHRFGENRTPAFALTVGTTLALVICFICHYFPSEVNHHPFNLTEELFNLCMLCSFTAYLSQCVGFLHMRYHFKFDGFSNKYTSLFGYRYYWN